MYLDHTSGLTFDRAFSLSGNFGLCSANGSAISLHFVAKVCTTLAQWIGSVKVFKSKGEVNHWTYDQVMSWTPIKSTIKWLLLGWVTI